MSLAHFALQRIKSLETLLEIEYQKLQMFEEQIAITASAPEKFELQQRLKRDVLPHLCQHEIEYAELLAETTSVERIPDREAEDILADVHTALVSVDSKKPADISGDFKHALADIKEKLDAPAKTAAAKLKVVLPLIPLIASYELELDTGAFWVKVWRRVRELFRDSIAHPPR
jgi:hypothetical protein